MGSGRVEVVSSKGCSKLVVGLSASLPSFRGLQSLEPTMSPAPSSVGSQPSARSSGPFSGLVICVTGLSKEARKQVMDATERLGGKYSPDLHPQCTHLIVQSFGGRKFEHALKHGPKNGLFIVTLGWFVDSVKRNVRLSETLYSVKSIGDTGGKIEELHRARGITGAGNSCLPASIHEAKKLERIEESRLLSSGREPQRSVDSMTLSGQSVYLDSDISTELQNKVIDAATREGASVVDKWYVGSNASHVVCEGTSIRRYLGHCNSLVTPLWLLKTAKEQHLQRLVHLSADLARQLGTMLDNYHNGPLKQETKKNDIVSEGLSCKASLEERQKIVNFAKSGVRNRRGRKMQTCQTPIRPITPSSLLDSICWSISEPTSTASIYTDSFSSDDGHENYPRTFFDAKGDGKDSEASFANLTRPLTESVKKELIFKDHFLTILFPVDRFGEMGPSSRTFFSDKGFTCFQVLDHIYAFYQENMSAQEIEVAIHTDSRHADRLRSVYCSKETADSGFVSFKRIDFLGSRRSFEMLKRVSGDNNSNVYELLVRA
ncbi:uncharacterized protein LOC104436359 [Eucalyptus grandis]|uniref:uncharacterized protein LOC104436359 n=1 Tax=Eucalyptus grandis TaxID=71139 RepID=UPI00192EF51E|nr:uncharacterized protein LOC104436359 [Eucalyptus grandis]